MASERNRDDAVGNGRVVEWKGTGRATRVNYHEHLKSKDWRRRRAEARRRAKGRCRVCKTTENLHTHHKTYKHLGRESQHELVMLCAEHHFACHDFIKLWKEKGWKHKSDYALTMKYVARERKKLQRKKGNSSSDDNAR